MTSNDKTFVKITNMDIYNKQKELSDKLDQYIRQNAEDHNKIIQRLDITNGKVKLGKWMATTAISIALITIGFLFSHLVK